MANITFQLLDKKNHNRADFDCGEPILNIFLQKNANQDIGHHKSRTFVCIASENSSEILGYYTLVYESFDINQIPKANRRGHKEIAPVLLLARLAVDVQFQHQGLGKLMMLNMFQKFTTSYQVAGGAGIGVNAKNDEVAHFYSKFGFIPSPINPLQLFLPARTLIKGFTQA